MLRSGEHAEEAPEHQLEAFLRILRRKVGNRRLLADDELQVPGQDHHELAVRTKRLPQGVAPALSSASLLLSSCRTRLWKACASVA